MDHRYRHKKHGFLVGKQTNVTEKRLQHQALAADGPNIRGLLLFTLHEARLPAFAWKKAVHFQRGSGGGMFVVVR